MQGISISIIFLTTHHPLVLAVYSPSPSLPMGTCTPAPPVADEHVIVASAVATAMLFVEDIVDRMSIAEKNFMILDVVIFMDGCVLKAFTSARAW